MKKRRKHNDSDIFANLTEDTILQLSNDLSEGIESGTIQDWRTVAGYWRERYALRFRETAELRTAICALLVKDQMKH